MKRFAIIKELYSVTPRNGKYTEDLLEKRHALEIQFFE